METQQALTRPATDAITHADPVLVRRAAERLYRFDIESAAARLQFAPASVSGRYFGLVTATTRRRLVHALVVAGGTA